MLNRLSAYVLIACVRVYQYLLAPWFHMVGGRCRFHPTCSHYGVEALKTHGAAKGFWLTAKRFVKCGPFHPGGVDPVPPKKMNV